MLVKGDPGALYNVRSYVSQIGMESGSCEIGSVKYLHRVKFNRYHSNSITVTSVAFQNDWTILNTIFVDSRLCEIVLFEALMDSETASEHNFPGPVLQTRI